MKTQGTLKDEIYTGSWKGNYWGRRGVIEKAKAERKAGRTNLSSLSSTYYSAAGNAYARVKLAPLWKKPYWMLRALWCLKSASDASDKYAEITGEWNMTPAELEIRARIQFRCRSEDKALATIRHANWKSEIPLETKALLLALEAEILYYMFGVLQHISVRHRYQEAIDLANKITPGAAIRVYRSAAQFFRADMIPDKEYAEKLEMLALVLADKCNLGDQTLKIKAEK